jgi:hypothetical protein
MADPRVPLYVRIGAGEAIALDRHVRATGRSKQAVVDELLSALDVGLPRSAAATSPTAPNPDAGDVLTLDELAAELRVEPADVLARVPDGLPGRRFGEHWRFSRQAVLRWLEGSDHTVPVAGFGAAPHQQGGR